MKLLDKIFGQNQHKPDCASNINCAVYHKDGICPGYKHCDCDATLSKEKDTCIGETILRKEKEIIKERDKELEDIHCLHKECDKCHGSGVTAQGFDCIHMISCPCKNCSIRM